VRATRGYTTLATRATPPLTPQNKKKKKKKKTQQKKKKTEKQRSGQCLEIVRTDRQTHL